MSAFGAKLKVRETWLHEYLLNSSLNETNCTSVQPRFAKVRKHVAGPHADGSITKEITDEHLFINAVFTANAVREGVFCEDSQEDWSLSSILLKEYHLKFQPNEKELVLVVTKFNMEIIEDKLALQKLSPVHYLSLPDINQMFQNYCHQLQSVDESSVQSCSLLLPMSSSSADQTSRTISKGHNNCTTSDLNHMRPLDLEHFLIELEDQIKLDSIEEWLSNYNPPSDPETFPSASDNNSPSLPPPGVSGKTFCSVGVQAFFDFHPLCPSVADAAVCVGDSLLFCNTQGCNISAQGVDAMGPLDQPVVLAKDPSVCQPGVDEDGLYSSSSMHLTGGSCADGVKIDEALESLAQPMLENTSIEQSSPSPENSEALIPSYSSQRVYFKTPSSACSVGTKDSCRLNSDPTISRVKNVLRSDFRYQSTQNDCSSSQHVLMEPFFSLSPLPFSQNNRPSSPFPTVGTLMEESEDLLIGGNAAVSLSEISSVFPGKSSKSTGKEPGKSGPNDKFTGNQICNNYQVDCGSDSIKNSKKNQKTTDTVSETHLKEMKTSSHVLKYKDFNQIQETEVSNSNHFELRSSNEPWSSDFMPNKTEFLKKVLNLDAVEPLVFEQDQPPVSEKESSNSSCVDPSSKIRLCDSVAFDATSFNPDGGAKLASSGQKYEILAENEDELDSFDEFLVSLALVSKNETVSNSSEPTSLTTSDRVVELEHHSKEPFEHHSKDLPQQEPIIYLSSDEDEDFYPIPKRLKVRSEINKDEKLEVNAANNRKSKLLRSESRNPSVLFKKLDRDLPAGGKKRKLFIADCIFDKTADKSTIHTENLDDRVSTMPNDTLISHLPCSLAAETGKKMDEPHCLASDVEDREAEEHATNVMATLASKLCGKRRKAAESETTLQENGENGVVGFRRNRDDHKNLHKDVELELVSPFVSNPVDYNRAGVEICVAFERNRSMDSGTVCGTLGMKVSDLNCTVAPNVKAHSPSLRNEARSLSAETVQNKLQSLTNTFTRISEKQYRTDAAHLGHEDYHAASGSSGFSVGAGCADGVIRTTTAQTSLDLPTRSKRSQNVASDQSGHHSSNISALSSGQRSEIVNSGLERLTIPTPKNSFPSYQPLRKTVTDDENHSSFERESRSSCLDGDHIKALLGVDQMTEEQTRIMRCFDSRDDLKRWAFNYFNEWSPGKR